MIEIGGRTDKAFSHIPHLSRITSPKLPHVIAVLIVPFSKRCRIGAQLIAARPNIPRLCNQLHFIQNRVLPNRAEKRPVPFKPACRAAQRGTQIKAKAINMHDFNPITQAIHHQSDDEGVLKVEGIPTTGIIDVIARIIRQPVVAGIVQAAKHQRRPHLGAFGGVVIDHIQNHFDPG